jgi:aerotolerance regulator-like protein
MPAFAEPLWLIGLAAMALPVALHLRGERASRVIRVGSVRWLDGAPAARSPAPRLTRVALLLLRCAVLAALSLALARPYQTGGSPGSSGAWVLVAPEILGHSLPDSLRRLGTVRLLAAGLPLLDASRPPAGDTPTDVWSLLREADAIAPDGIRFVVVAPGTVPFVRGTRPELRHPVEWRTAKSDPVPAARQAGGGAVTIFAGAEREEDARYLAAAFKAGIVARGVSATVVVRPIVGEPDAETAWIGWLGAAAVPATLERRLQAGARLVTDGDTAPLAAGDRVVWRAADGGPLLVAHAKGRGTHFRLRGRFHPSTLPPVLRPEFAEWVDSLWAPAPLRSTAPDLPVSRAQRTPALSEARPSARTDAARSPDLGRGPADLLLALAAICWLAERAITAREPAA